MKRSRRLGIVLILGGGAVLACHGERPDAVAPPADAGVPGLLPAKSAPPPAESRSSADGSVASAPLASASRAEPPVAPRRSAASIPQSALASAVAANNAFALALFEQVRVGSAKSNLLTSPISAELALTMAYAGATGETRAEMATALHFRAIPAQTVFDGQNALSQALQGRGPAALELAARGYHGNAGSLVADDYQLTVVNSIWGEASYPWQAAFLHTLAADYGAPLYKRDFIHEPEPARRAINAWVSKQTADKINDLLPENAVSSETRLVLVNALHVKLPWQTAFRPGNTAPASFTRGDQTQTTTSFMNSQDSLAYVDDGAAQVVALPLFGEEVSVVIALPHAGTSLDAYERSLRAGSAALVPPKKKALLALSVPKVAFTSPSFSLKTALQALGMKRAFEENQAQFADMCALPPDVSRLLVSDVVQKTMIDVQETGVEAAAATAVVMRTASLPLPRNPPPVPIPMVVNRPYLLAVVDVPTGAILMLGHISDPSQTASH